MNHGKNTIKRRSELVIFDLDNTLCDHHTSLMIRLDHAFQHAFPDEETRAEVIAASVEMATDGTAHFEDLFRDAGVSDADLLEITRDRYRSDRFRGLELFEDVLEGIAAVSKHYEVGIITNGPTDIQQPKIDLLEIESLFSFVLISESTGFWKPDPRIFELALSATNTPAHQAIYVGDSPDHDISGARLAGLDAIWMNRRGIEWPTSIQPGPDYQVSDMHDLLTLLGI